MVGRGQDHQLVTQAQADTILQEGMTREEDIQDKEEEANLLGGHILHQGKITPQWIPITKPEHNMIPKLSLKASSKNTLTISQA